MKGLQSKPEALSEHLKGLWATDGCAGRPQRAFERSPLRAERCRQRDENETTIEREDRGQGGRRGGVGGEAEEDGRWKGEVKVSCRRLLGGRHKTCLGAI